jgi:hypothetical protein
VYPHLIRSRAVLVFLSGALSLFALSIVSAPALAMPLLTYDDPVIEITPGQSVLITAKLSVSSSDGAFITNASAQPFNGPPSPFIGSLYFYQPEPSPTIVFPPPTPPAIDFGAYSSVSFLPSSSLANLDVAPGSTIDLVLGLLETDDTLPLGTYTTDIGISQGCVDTCFANPFAPPNYFDPGNLTIDVVAVPEPATLSIFGAGLVALGVMRRKRNAN